MQLDQVCREKQTNSAVEFLCSPESFKHFSYLTLFVCFYGHWDRRDDCLVTCYGKMDAPAHQSLGVTPSALGHYSRVTVKHEALGHVKTGLHSQSFSDHRHSRNFA